MATLYLFGIAIAGADAPVRYMWINFIGVAMLLAALAIVILADKKGISPYEKRQFKNR